MIWIWICFRVWGGCTDPSSCCSNVEVQPRKTRLTIVEFELVLAIMYVSWALLTVAQTEANKASFGLTFCLEDFGFGSRIEMVKLCSRAIETGGLRSESLDSMAWGLTVKR